MMALEITIKPITIVTADIRVTAKKTLFKTYKQNIAIWDFTSRKFWQ